MLRNDVFLNLLRFIVLVLLQVILFDHIQFLGFINPFPYILFILLFPLSGNRSLLIFLSFLIGLSVDVFNNSGGVHAAACVFIGYIRPVLLKFSFGVSYEYNMVNIRRVDFTKRLLYVMVMVFIHHFILFSLETFNISHILLVLKNTFFSGIFTIILIMGSMALFRRN